MNDCIFCRIVSENKPHHEIWWENDSHIAFLDASPSKPGHTLVIPRKHTEEILQLTEEAYTDLLLAVRVVAKKMREFFNVPRIAIVVEGMSVSHVHVHLIPIHKKGDLGIFTTCEMVPGEFKRLADKLRATI